MQDTINYGTRGEEKKITALGLHTVSAEREPLGWGIPITSELRNVCSITRSRQIAMLTEHNSNR